MLMEMWGSLWATVAVDRSTRTSYALTDGQALPGGGAILANSSSFLWCSSGGWRSSAWKEAKPGSLVRCSTWWTLQALVVMESGEESIWAPKQKDVFLFLFLSPLLYSFSCRREPSTSHPCTDSPASVGCLRLGERKLITEKSSYAN